MTALSYNETNAKKKNIDESFFFSLQLIFMGFSGDNGWRETLQMFLGLGRGDCVNQTKDEMYLYLIGFLCSTQ